MSGCHFSAYELSSSDFNTPACHAYLGCFGLPRMLLAFEMNARFLPGTQRSSCCKKGLLLMPLLQVIEVVIVVGVLLWLVNRFIPMQGTIKSILNGIVVIALVIWLLNVFGLLQSFSRIHIGK